MVIPIPSTLIPPHPLLLDSPHSIFTPIKPIQRTIRWTVWVHTFFVLLLLIGPYPAYALIHGLTVYAGFIAAHGKMPAQYGIFACLALIACVHNVYFLSISIWQHGFGYSESLKLLEVAEGLSKNNNMTLEMTAAKLAAMLEARFLLSDTFAAKDLGKSYTGLLQVEPQLIAMTNQTRNTLLSPREHISGDAAESLNITSDDIVMYISIPAYWRICLEVATLAATAILCAVEAAIAGKAATLLYRIITERLSYAINEACANVVDETTHLHVDLNDNNNYSVGAPATFTSFSGQSLRIANLRTAENNNTNISN